MDTYAVLHAGGWNQNVVFLYGNCLNWSFKGEVLVYDSLNFYIRHHSGIKGIIISIIGVVEQLINEV